MQWSEFENSIWLKKERVQKS